MRRRDTVADPSVLNIRRTVAGDDAVANATSWEPHRQNSANFRTLTITKVSPARMESKVTFGSWLFVGVFVAIGVFIPLQVISFEGGFLVKVMIGIFSLLFCGAGALTALRVSEPFFFDKGQNRFARGHVGGISVPFHHSEYVTCPLSDIYAIQVLEYEVVTHKGGRYPCYEVNLVLNDSQRLFVFAHGDRRPLQQDAEMLSRFLGVPFWDTCR